MDAETAPDVGAQQPAVASGGSATAKINPVIVANKTLRRADEHTPLCSTIRTLHFIPINTIDILRPCDQIELTEINDGAFMSALGRCWYATLSRRTAKSAIPPASPVIEKSSRRTEM